MCSIQELRKKQLITYNMLKKRFNLLSADLDLSDDVIKLSPEAKERYVLKML